MVLWRGCMMWWGKVAETISPVNHTPMPHLEALLAEAQHIANARGEAAFESQREAVAAYETLKDRATRLRMDHVMAEDVVRKETATSAQIDAAVERCRELIRRRDTYITIAMKDAALRAVYKAHKRRLDREDLEGLFYVTEEDRERFSTRRAS